MANDAPRLTRRTAIGLAGVLAAVPAVSSTTAYAKPPTTSGTSSGGFNVKSFGAMGDSNATGTAGTDDTAAIQSAISYIYSLGGGTLYFPEGYYKISSYLTVCANLRIVGAGRRGAYIVTSMGGRAGATNGENVRNGSALYSGWPSNNSTNASVLVEHLGFICANPANVGAAFYDNGGTYIQVHDCFVTGFRYGIVLDQSEFVDIDRCEFSMQNGGGAAVYLVNGPTLTPVNLTTFTNRISITRCQINEYQGTYGILDEGGYTHSFIDNNYNGCLNHIYAAGVQALQIIGGEFESCAAASIELEFRRVADGTGVGGSTGVIMGMMNIQSAQPCIDITATSGPLSIIGNCLLRGDGNPPIAGAKNANALHLVGNALHASCDGELVDNCNGGTVFDSRIEMPVGSNFNRATLNLTRAYSEKLIRCTRTTAQTLTIQADAIVPLPTGARFIIQQTTPGGTAAFVAAEGVTIAGPLMTSGQYQKITARKIAANSWETEVTVQDPRQIAPSTIQ